jgi:hypothetical protein
MSKETTGHTEWIPFNKGIEVNVCVIIKRRKGSIAKWELTEVESWKGDWSDLVWALYEDYGIFRDRTDYLPTKVARYEKLDQIAAELADQNVPYEFVMPDFTDDWYIAYVKPVRFRMDPDGSLG